MEHTDTSEPPQVLTPRTRCNSARGPSPHSSVMFTCLSYCPVFNCGPEINNTESGTIDPHEAVIVPSFDKLYERGGYKNAPFAASLSFSEHLAMKLLSPLALVGATTIVGASFISEKELVERDTCSDGTTALQAQKAFVYPLYEACKSRLLTNVGDPWGNPACVAAAIVGSPGLVLDALSCESSDVPALSSLPNLDYGAYAQIVGSCAYDSTACGITQQNFIDFVYREIGTETEAVWPTSSAELVSSYIDPLMEWTATGDSVPYTNFNDWLHYAPDDAVATR